MRQSRNALLPLFCMPLLAAAAHAQAGNDADPASDEVITLPEFEVSASAVVDGYIASEATSGTRIGSKIVELPFTVQVLTEEFVQDFQFFEADQQFSYVSGYSPGATDAGDGPRGSRIRGFPPLVLVDGFSRVGVPDAITVSQTEIIKGPQSTLYGRAQPGGMINYVTKRPRATARYSLQAIMGSYNFERFSLEATGPLIKDKLYYFGGAVYSYNEGDMDFFFLRQFLVGAGLTWKISDNTSATLKFEKQDRTQNRGARTEFRAGTFPVSLVDPLRRTGGVVTGVHLPLATFNQYGPNNRAVRETEKYGLLFEHRINPTWSFRVNAQYFDTWFDEVRRTLVHFVQETQRFNESAPFSSTTGQSGAAFQTDLLARFQTGTVGHMLLFAADWGKERLRREDYQLPGRAEVMAQPDSVRFLDPFNPDWTPIDRSQLTRLSNLFDREQVNWGSFASHRGFFFRGRLVTIAGVRYDEARADVEAPRAGIGKDSSVSYVSGFNYNVFNNDSVVLYANRSTSFNPSVTIDEGTGEPQKNEEAEGWEVGLKSISLGERLALTLAVYELTRLNIPTSNPDYLSPVETPGQPQYLGQGVERAEGLDFDFSLRPSRSLTLIGSFGYTSAWVAENPDNPQLVGDVLIRIPKNTGSLAVRYVFREGPLRGVRLGASGSYTGGVLVSRESDSRLRDERGPLRLYNGFIGYNWRSKKTRNTHSVQLNVLNVFDEFYLDIGGRVGRGREVRGSYKLQF